MTFALITATRFRFSYEANEQLPLRTLNKDLKRTIYPTTKERNVYSSSGNDEQQMHFQSEQQTYAKSSTMKFMQLVQVFMTLKNGTFLFIAW